MSRRPSLPPRRVTSSKKCRTIRPSVSSKARCICRRISASEWSPEKLKGNRCLFANCCRRISKIELERLRVSDAMKAASFLAGVVGKAHARQMDAVTRKSCSNELNRHRSKSLEAPSWLWTSVVALVGAHEIAYLEHCRKHATGVTA